MWSCDGLTDFRDDFCGCWLLFCGVMGVSDCNRELKMTCLGWLMFVMASMTEEEGASFGTLNSMMPKCVDVGQERRFSGLVVSSKM